MKPLAGILAISLATVLCGCGGAPAPPAMPAAILPTTAPPATPQIPMIAGNWQFTATSAVPGTPPFGLAGGLTQASATVNGALHVNGSHCFDQLTVMGVMGTLTTNGTSLTATGINGQTVTLTGSFTNSTFSGTYRVNGVCASGDEGNVTGINIPYIANNLSGSFTSSTQGTAATFSAPPSPSNLIPATASSRCSAP
jgi:hypothetical protein